jgi:hypothetical protein
VLALPAYPRADDHAVPTPRDVDRTAHGGHAAPTPSSPVAGAASASSSSGAPSAPVLALLVLLVLAAPSLSRFFRTAPVFLRPTPFVCALERPG